MTEKKQHSYGGQAVIEGVMIRGCTSVVTAIRRPGGEITVDTRPVPAITTGWMRRTPLVRGVVVLIEAMVLGIRSLILSANVAVEEETEEIPTKAIWGMIAVAAILVVLLFFIAPLFLTKLLNPYIPNSVVFHIIEGIIRLAIFIGYLKLISLLPDLKRVFTYHGAEHKAVNAYEAGVPMEVAAIKTHSTAHVRCGTSFLFLVLIIAIIIFAFIGRDILWLMIVSRIVLIPVIMALGYEVIYFGSRHDSQLEVAIAAMNKAVELDQAAEEAQTSPAGLAVESDPASS
jgi:uncharacterized protein YqhQ